MTVLTLPELMNRQGANLIMRAIAKGIVTTDYLFASIPFRTFVGAAVQYQRERSLGEVEFIADDGVMPEPTHGTDDLVTVPVRRVASDLDVDSLTDDLTGGAEMGNQILKKVKAVGRLIMQKMASGGHTTGFTIEAFQGGVYVDAITAYSSWLDSNRYGPGALRYTHVGTKLAFKAPGDTQYGDDVTCIGDGSFTLYSSNKNKWITVTVDVSDATANAERMIRFTSTTDEFDGLTRIVSPSMVVPSVGTDGDLYSFGVLDRLMGMEKVRTNRAFIMNDALVRKHLSSLRTVLGGANPEHVRLAGIGADTLAYRGVPILTNDWIPSNEAKGAATTLSSVYLASLDAAEGLFLGVPGTGVDRIDVDGDPRRENVLGFRIEKLGALEDKAHRRTRVQWYGTLGLASELALARASEIITA